MKPCSRNRKAINALVLGNMPELEARQLQAHLDHCAGCRQLAEELTRLGDDLCFLAEPVRQQTEEGPSPFLHQRVLQRIQSSEKEAIRQMKPPGLWHWAWRLVVVGATAAVILFLGWFAPNRPRQPQAEMARIESSMHVSESSAETNADPPTVGPTLLRYRMAANDSLEELDALLSSSPVWTGALRQPMRAGDGDLVQF